MASGALIVMILLFYLLLFVLFLFYFIVLLFIILLLIAGINCYDFRAPQGADSEKGEICWKGWEGNEKKIRAKAAQGQSWESWKGNSRGKEGMVLLESHTATSCRNLGAVKHILW